MKISEFIRKYTVCPVCNDPLECSLYFDLADTVYYLMTELSDTGFHFSRQKEKHVSIDNDTYMREHIKICSDCAAMPSEFTMLNHFVPPASLFPNQYDQGVKSALIKLACLRNDFSICSTNFNIFHDIQNIEISIETAEIKHDKIACIWNDNEEKKTYLIFKNFRVENASITIPLIPLDKWPLNDKNKLGEKIDKLLVLS